MDADTGSLTINSPAVITDIPTGASLMAATAPPRALVADKDFPEASTLSFFQHRYVMDRHLFRAVPSSRPLGKSRASEIFFFCKTVAK